MKINFVREHLDLHLIGLVCILSITSRHMDTTVDILVINFLGVLRRQFGIFDNIWCSGWAEERLFCHGFLPPISYFSKSTSSALFSLTGCLTDRITTSFPPLLFSATSHAVEATNAEFSVITIEYPVTEKFGGGMTAELLICQDSVVWKRGGKNGAGEHG